jgi:hypothetical protein
VQQNQNFQMDYFQHNYRTDMAHDQSNRLKLEQSQNTLDLANKLDFMLRNDFKDIHFDKNRKNQPKKDFNKDPKKSHL